MQSKKNEFSEHKGTARTTGSLFLALALGFAVACNGIGATLTWVGDDSSNLWDINTSQNWHDGSGVAVYNDGDTVTIDDSGSDSPSINLTTTVSPASVTVDNTTKNYTIEGGGTLAGAMTLTKAGTGTLKLSTANTFTGAVTNNAGTLELAQPADCRGHAHGRAAGRRPAGRRNLRELRGGHLAGQHRRLERRPRSQRGGARLHAGLAAGLSGAAGATYSGGGIRRTADTHGQRRGGSGRQHGFHD